MNLLQYTNLIQDPGERETLAIAVRNAIHATGAEEGSILLLDTSALQLEFVMCCTRDGVNQALIGQRVPVTEGLVGMAVQSGEPQIGAPRYTGVAQAALGGADATHPTSVLAVPLVHNDRPLGVMTLVSFDPRFRFTVADARHYEGLAGLVALVLHKQAVVQDLSSRVLPDSPGGPEQRLLRSAHVLSQGAPERMGEIATILEAFARLQ